MEIIDERVGPVDLKLEDLQEGKMFRTFDNACEHKLIKGQKTTDDNFYCTNLKNGYVLTYHKNIRVKEIKGCVVLRD